jgi:ferredoxin-NADP reductase
MHPELAAEGQSAGPGLPLGLPQYRETTSPYGIVQPTGITPFAALVEQVMTTEPYASARRVFWVVDNGSSHAGTASIQRMAAAWPTATLVHLPVHASWLNQIEIVFSILQRKVIAPADFTDREALTRRITEFEPRFNATATPFDWRFTRADLQRLLAGIDDQHNGVVLPAAA